VVVLSAAHECSSLDADDAFAVVLALADGGEADRDRYERAVVRWLARAASELKPPPDPTELQLLLAALRALPTAATALAAAEALSVLFEARGMRQASRALSVWLDRRG
jgi:hypothetical protein